MRLGFRPDQRGAALELAAGGGSSEDSFLGFHNDGSTLRASEIQLGCEG